MNKKQKLDMNDVISIIDKIDYKIILSLFLPIISYYSSKFVVNAAFKLYKGHKQKDISKIEYAPVLKPTSSKVDFKNLVAQKFKYIIFSFAATLKKNFPEEYLVNFYNNINNVNIFFKSKEKCNKEFGVSTYDAVKNEIELHNEGAIYHELFHLASSATQGLIYSGFSQSKGILQIGDGINEGYTELLTQRYFGNKKAYASYEYEVYVVELLEQIVGEDKMQQMYFNADLLGLIRELKKYSSEEEIMEFISTVDFINNNDDKKLIQNLSKPLSNKLKFVNKFLLKAYCVKLKDQLESRSLSSKHFNVLIAEFLHSVGKYIKINEKEFEILSNNEIIKILNTVFDEEKYEVRIR